MSALDWLLRARLTWDETRHTAFRAFRAASPAASPNAMQLEDRVLLSASPVPVVADGDTARMDGAADLFAQASAEVEQTAAGSAVDATADDVRTAADALALLDGLSNDLERATLEESVNTSPGSDSLLQFSSSNGHILGFGQSMLIVAAPSHSLQVEFIGANRVGPAAPAAATDADVTPGAAAPLTSVTYAGLWDGITAVYEAQEGALLKSTYYVGAGLEGNPADQIRLHYNRDVSVDEQGNLVIAYDNGTLTDSAPIAWQDIDGQRQLVQVSYELLGNNQVGFAVGAYDHSQQLVIDPSLTWSTFLGGSGTDYCYGIAVDSSGNVYIGGSSNATWGSPVRAYSSGYDAFAAKLDSSGNLQWNTFLGGSGTDYGRGIAVDSSGNVYVGGYSAATWGSPVRAFTSGTDAFAAKLDSSGNLQWNTFLGGSGTDNGYDIAVDNGGNVYIGGYSNATWGSSVRAYTSGADAFAAKLDSSGTLQWNTFLGGSGYEYGYAIA
ncbi:MAG: DUF7948 domain-containing protein, partial [Pirellulaceae bacterium]